jgi:hypothetical protein
MSMTMSPMGSPIEMHQPVITYPCSIEVADFADGRWNYKITFDRVTMSPTGKELPGLIAQLEKVFAGFQGMTIEGAIGAQGDSFGASLKLPATMEPSVKQLMESMANSLDRMGSVLPGPEVGVGAKWRVILPSMTISNIEMRVVNSYELKAIEDSQFVLAGSSTVSTPEQQLQLPGLPESQQAFLLASSQTSQFDRLQVKIDSPLPDVSIQNSSDSVIEIRSQDDPPKILRRMEQSVRMKFRMEVAP